MPAAWFLISAFSLLAAGTIQNTSINCTEHASGARQKPSERQRSGERAILAAQSPLKRNIYQI